MSQANVEVVRHGFAALAGQGSEGVIPYLTEDELRDVHDGGDSVVGLLELSGQTKRAALPMRMEIGAVYSGITDGRVAGLRLFSTWSGALEAVGLRE